MCRIAVCGLLFATACLTAAPSWAGVNVWTPIGPDGGEILALEAHPRQGNVVFAGTRGGVFKSTDRGATWRLASRGLQNLGISAIAVAPSNGIVVYAASAGTVFASRDGGETWRATARPLGPPVTALDVGPGDSRNLWAATENGVFRSRNGGNTWERASSSPISRVVDLVVDPFAPEAAYIANLTTNFDLGVFKTTDGGATWVELDVGPGFATTAASLAADPAVPGLLYATFEYGPASYRSTDGGATWKAIEAGYPAATNSVGGVYIGAMHSEDHGETWSFIAAPYRTRRYAASATGGAVLGATEDLGVVRHLDGDTRWEMTSRGLHATNVTSLAINPRRPRVIYSAVYRTRSVGAFKTENAGADWRTLFVPEYTESFFPRPLLALSPLEPARVYIAWRSPQGLDRTENGAVFWVPLRDIHTFDAPFSPTQILADPTDPETVYLLGTQVGAPRETCSLARSTDRGETFDCPPPFDTAAEEVQPFGTRLFADPSRPGRLWLPARRDRFWRSDDSGATWTAVRPAGLRNAGEPRALAFDPAVPNRLYLTTELTGGADRSERLWRSDDGGLNWNPWGRNLPGGAVTDLLIDPRQPSLQYAVVNRLTDTSRPGQLLSGVFMSRNGGRTWGPLFNGLPLSVTGLVMDPTNPGKLYALTHNLGVYTFTRQ